LRNDIRQLPSRIDVDGKEVLAARALDRASEMEHEVGAIDRSRDCIDVAKIPHN
jgi:hypothetical protein